MTDKGQPLQGEFIPASGPEEDDAVMKRVKRIIREGEAKENAIEGEFTVLEPDAPQ